MSRNHYFNSVDILGSILNQDADYVTDVSVIVLISFMNSQSLYLNVRSLP
jgi:hypothetical protein